ncbi:MAG: hypothetical protein ACE5F1_04890 [Planctomycetota bacterium]
MEPVSEKQARRQGENSEPDTNRGAAPARSVFRDPREDEDWFQKLDAVTRELFRSEWRHHAINARRHEQLRRASRLRGPIGGAVVFFLAHTVFAPFWMSWGRTLAAILVGAAVGDVWYRMKAGRSQSIMTGLPVHLCLVLAFSSGTGTLMLFVQLLLSSCAFITLAGFAGVGREFRRREGSEV